MKKNILSLLLLYFAYHNSLHATHGYHPNGIGVKAIGMGGVAVALPQDTLVPATNPAGIALLNNQVDIGGAAFIPFRKYCYSGGPGISPDTVASENDVFALPAMGISYRLTEYDILDVAVFGNGGKNTNYPRNNPVFGARDPINAPLNLPFTQASLGVNFLQTVIAPTYAHTFPYQQSFGICPLICIQAFKVKGLYGIANSVFSSNPCLVTDKAHDVVPAIGLGIGWLGIFWDRLQIGAGYSTKLYSRRFKHYKGLLAHQGKFDVPAILNIGCACTDIIQGFIFAFDYQRIFYGDIPSLAHSIDRFGLPINPVFIKHKLGTDEGPGFGWRTINIFKVGIAYQLYDWITIRSGFSHGDPPFDPARNIDFNIIAPAVIQNHITVGMTLYLKNGHELDLAYGHAFGNTVCGQSFIGLGTVALYMRQNFVNVNLSFKF